MRDADGRGGRAAVQPGETSPTEEKRTSLASEGGSLKDRPMPEQTTVYVPRACKT